MRSAALLPVLLLTSVAGADHTKNILLTGYWPPTNEMVRRFSTNSTQNPLGWIGQNWEGRGFDVYSFFPEFPGGTGINPQGNGDLMVDYQDTSTDWWSITEQIKPVAIITFSRASSGAAWEVEFRTKNRLTWTNDYIIPRQPTPAPPDASVPAETIRFSTLPMQNIVNAVNQSGPLAAFIDSSSTTLAGGFLSEFIGYHGSWYQSIHAAPTDPYQCVAAGHIHVGINASVANAAVCVDITLRELIAHVNAQFPCYANCDGSSAAPILNVSDFTCFLTKFAANESYANCDGSTGEPTLNVADFSCFLQKYAAGCS